jgi:hypothetical protein
MAQSCTLLASGANWAEWDLGYTGGYSDGTGFGKLLDRRIYDNQHLVTYDAGNGQIVRWSMVSWFSCGPA